MVEYFKGALSGKGKVYVGNSDVNAAALMYGDEGVVTPLIYEGQYINFLLDYCLKKRVSAIIPLFDIDLYVLALNKAIFEEKNIRVVVSDASVIEVCNDKWKTGSFLRQNGILTPKTYLSLDTARTAVENGEIAFPLVVKPRWGMGSIGIYEANTMEELNIFSFAARRQVENTYLKFESAQNFEESILVQEKIRGQEYGLDIMNDLEGTYQNTVVRKKCAMRAGETDIAVIVENKVLKNLGKNLSRVLRHVGNLDIDLILTEENIPYVIDLNARFGGGYPFSHCAGVNLPKAIVAWLEGKKVERKILQPQIGIKGYKNISVVADVQVYT